ncbi:g3208 [Coccomyxa viridis]|uniref:G3208 protein n=1 Tax=Coccomyxa viridis TaxID=1274662 RepID=A0ABP1FNV9_9CHLO
MNSNNAHSDESLSCNVSETSTAETDTFDDILSRYTCTCDPELCLKLRRSVGPVSLRANRYFNGRCDRWAFVVRPADEEKHKWIHRLAIEPACERASLSTSKIRLWQILRVQAVASYDWDTRIPGLQWRVSSKWSRGQGKLGRKEKLRYGGLPAVELHPHWRMDLFMPEVEGTLGGGSRDQSVHVEKGHCHVSIPKLEVLLDLNDVSGTKDQLATLLQRVGRRNRKVPAQEPIPSCASESTRLEAAGESPGISFNHEQEHAIADLVDYPASVKASSSSALSRRPQRSWKDTHRQSPLKPPEHGLLPLSGPPHQRYPGQQALEHLGDMWKRVTQAGRT